MKLIQRREHKQVAHFEHHWGINGEPTRWMGLPCDSEGNLLPDDIDRDETLQEMKARFDRDTSLTYEGIKTYWRTHAQCAVGECECGRKVTLSGFTNSCDCGKDYNTAGNLLAHRRHWGEETGESLSDILNIDGDDYGETLYLD